MAKVDITIGDHTVIIESEDPIERLVEIAKKLHEETRPKPGIGAGPAGFHCELAEESP